MDESPIELGCETILNARPLAVRGRGRPLAVATCDPSEQTITVRIDSYDDAASWCEVTLSRADLLALLTPPPEASVARELEAWRTGDFSETVSEQPLCFRCPCCAALREGAAPPHCEECDAICLPETTPPSAG